jgi:hypothetical protein
MTLRIDKTFEGNLKVLRLIGDLRSSEVQMLESCMKYGGTGLKLDLQDLSIVDVSAVRFLAGCEVSGAEIVNCPPYVREWIKREADRRRQAKDAGS